MIWLSQNFKKQFLRGRHAMFMDRSCQTRLSRQTCIKIESFDICLWRITFARQWPTIVDVSSFWFVLLWDIPSYSIACRNRSNINCDKNSVVFVYPVSPEFFYVLCLWSQRIRRAEMLSVCDVKKQWKRTPLKVKSNMWLVFCLIVLYSRFSSH